MPLINHSPLMAFFLILVAVLYPDRPAFAYLDPATTSMVLQMILGGVAGALVVTKLYWYRLKVFFGYNQTGQSGRVTEATEKAEAGK